MTTHKKNSKDLLIYLRNVFRSIANSHCAKYHLYISSAILYFDTHFAIILILSAMAQVVFMLIIFSRILSATSVGVFHYFRENTELSNKALKNTLNKDIQTSSLFDCGARCQLCCRCFGFNTVTNICRVFLTCDQNDIIGIEEGWIYHYRNELGEKCQCIFVYVWDFTLYKQCIGR